MTRFLLRRGLPVAMLLAALLANPATPAGRAPKAGPAAYQPAATFQEVMDSVVDPAADAVWGAVSTTYDAAGVHEHRPTTAEEWHQLRRHGIQLMEAANLITVPGRRVAHGDHAVEDGSPLDVAAIQRRLDAGHAQLVSMAGAMREVARTLVAAADRRDVEGVMEAGGALDEACEACHKVYWYPDATAGRKPRP